MVRAQRWGTEPDVQCDSHQMCFPLQAFVVKVEREGVQQGAALVQRSFEEFHELHCKLRLIFPSSKLPRYVRAVLMHHRLLCPYKNTR